ncbi:MAG: RNA 2',3'-cyclic phosphodiesterase [Candidatus Syntrophoarchaeum sp.]|nr:RNA 2',3'-cyclic phosphodiesterase [Candidatus Syntrophoarchaeum sp.]
MRAFIAVDLSEELRAKIKEVQKQFTNLEIDQSRLKLKFVNAWQAHQTVKFLGDVPENKVEDVKRELVGISQKPFDIGMRGVGFFPEASPEKARNIRVVWIGIEKGVEELKALQEEVESRLRALGFPSEKRFSAHVTICRVKMTSRAGTRDEIGRILKKIAELGDVEVGEMPVEELKLKKSTLTPKGPIYEDVYVKKLNAL